MSSRRLWAFGFVCLLLVPFTGLSQERAVQEMDTDRFTFGLGLMSMFQADTEINYPQAHGVPDAFDVFYEGNLFGPVFSVQIANTDTFWDNFEFVVSSYFGELEAYDSAGFGASSGAVFSKMVLDVTDVRTDVCYRIIPYFALFLDYRYKKWEFERGRGEWPSEFPREEEMYAGGIGAKGGVPLGKTGAFVYGSAELIPYAEFLHDDNNAWGTTIKGGLGYSVEGGEWLPMTLTLTAGYRYHKMDSDGYFDERSDSGTADVVVSW